VTVTVETETKTEKDNKILIQMIMGWLAPALNSRENKAWFAPSIIRANLFRSRFGLPWKEEYYIGGNINYEALASDLCKLYPSATTLKDIQIAVSRVAWANDRTWAERYSGNLLIRDLNHSTNGRSRIANGNAGDSVTIDIQASECESGTASYYRTNYLSGEVSIPLEVIADAAGESDRDIIINWLYENVNSGDLETTDDNGTSYENEESTDYDNFEFDDSVRLKAKTLMEEFRDNHPELFPVEGEEV